MSKYPWYPECLVIGPGGVKGFLELGAIRCLERKGFIQYIRAVCGCSVGALIGLMLVSGYTVQDIIKEAVELDIFRDIELSRVSEHLGVLDHRSIAERLSNKMKEKFGLVPTLHQLYLFTGMEFVVVTCNLDAMRTEHISYKTEPHLSVINAVLLSINIPFLFKMKPYRGCVYADGAFGNPYPIDVFDDGNRHILGLYIHTTDRLREEKILWYLAECPNVLQRGLVNFLLKAVVPYVYKTVCFSMNELYNRIYKNCSDKCHHLTLKTDILDIAGITIDHYKRGEMLMDGYNQAKLFLRELRHPEYRPIETNGDDVPFIDDTNQSK